MVDFELDEFGVVAGTAFFGGGEGVVGAVVDEAFFVGHGSRILGLGVFFLNLI